MSEAMRFVGMTVGQFAEYVERDRDLEVVENIARVASSVSREVSRAMLQHAPMHSPHEGYAVIKEELEELWDLVKAYPKRASLEDMRSEAIQTAAMAIRFVLDVCERGGNPSLNPGNSAHQLASGQTNSAENTEVR